MRRNGLQASAAAAQLMERRSRLLPSGAEGRGDSLLTIYFREMSRHPVMSVDEELAAARAIERVEVDHWVALLSHLPAAAYILVALAEDIPTSEDKIQTPQLAELSRLLGVAKKQRGKLSRDQEREWTRLSTDLALIIRLPDADRAWMAHAQSIARDLVREPGIEDDGLDVEEGRLALPILPMSEAYRLYLERVEQTFGIQDEAKRSFVNANLRLVISVARRFNRGRLSLIDLIQEGNLGLMKAVERFDHTRGYRFSTYASWWIRHGLSRAIADKGRQVRIPVHMLDLYNRVARAIGVFVARVGREPTVQELEKETSIPFERLEKARDFHMEIPFSLDRPIGDADGQKFVDLLQEETPSPYEQLVQTRWQLEVRRLLKMLTPIEARILRWRFGLDNEDELTLKEIGDKYNLSRERIRQLQEQALSKIRRQMRDY